MITRIRLCIAFSCNIRLGILVLLVFAIQAFSAAQDDEFDFRYGIAPASSFDRLFKKGEIISSHNMLIQADNEKYLTGHGEFHAVYDVLAEAFLSVLKDFSNYRHFAPWVVDSKVVSQYENSIITEFFAGINFMGLRVGYATVSMTIIEELGTGMYGLRSRFLNSPDNSMYMHYVSWYLEAIELHGRSMTYVRYYSRPGIRNGTQAMLAVSKIFADGNIRKLVDSIAREAISRGG